MPCGIAHAPFQLPLPACLIVVSSPTAGFLAVADEGWRRTLDLNLLTTVRASRTALPSLIERGGAVVNIASINARLPQTPVVDYAPAKAALVNLFKALAEEFGPRGVRVSAISRRPVRTALWEEPGRFGADLAGAMGVRQGHDRGRAVAGGRRGPRAERR